MWSFCVRLSKAGTFGLVALLWQQQQQQHAWAVVGCVAVTVLRESNRS